MPLHIGWRASDKRLVPADACIMEVATSTPSQTPLAPAFVKGSGADDAPSKSSPSRNSVLWQQAASLLELKIQALTSLGEAALLSRSGHECGPRCSVPIAPSLRPSVVDVDGGFDDSTVSCLEAMVEDFMASLALSAIPEQQSVSLQALRKITEGTLESEPSMHELREAACPVCGSRCGDVAARASGLAEDTDGPSELQQELGRKQLELDDALAQWNDCLRELQEAREQLLGRDRRIAALEAQLRSQALQLDSASAANSLSAAHEGPRAAVRYVSRMPPFAAAGCAVSVPFLPATCQHLHARPGVFLPLPFA